jgi:hypothetical protein
MTANINPSTATAKHPPTKATKETAAMTKMTEIRMPTIYKSQLTHQKWYLMLLTRRVKTLITNNGDDAKNTGVDETAGVDETTGVTNEPPKNKRTYQPPTDCHGSK